jgi:hypothetical protein
MGNSFKHLQTAVAAQPDCLLRDALRVVKLVLLEHETLLDAGLTAPALEALRVVGLRLAKVELPVLNDLEAARALPA